MMTTPFPEETAAGHGDHRRPAEPPVSRKKPTAREAQIEIGAQLSETSRDHADTKASVSKTTRNLADTMASGSLAQQQFRMLCRQNEDVGTIVIVPISAQSRPAAHVRGEQSACLVRCGPGCWCAAAGPANVYGSFVAERHRLLPQADRRVLPGHHRPGPAVHRRRRAARHAGAAPWPLTSRCACAAF